MKKYATPYLFILAVFLILSAGGISAQQLTPYVLSTSGSFYSNSSGMLSFTTGEMSAIETYTSPANILTQGFQQTWELSTAIQENQPSNVSFLIYPNPTYGYFNLEMKGEGREHVVVKIIDILGKEILHTSFEQENTTQVEPIDASDFSQGLYLINITVLNKYTLTPSYQFIRKIQIVR